MINSYVIYWFMVLCSRSKFLVNFAFDYSLILSKKYIVVHGIVLYLVLCNLYIVVHPIMQKRYKSEFI
jgi:hypothetical protein